MVNLMLLSTRIDHCATLSADPHVHKIALEILQMIYNCHQGNNELIHPPYKVFNKRHPMSIFIRSCKSAYLFALHLCKRLLKNYSLRYKKQHKCYERVLELCSKPVPADIPDVQADNFPEKENLYTMSETFNNKKQVLLATTDIPAGCKWFPLCLTDTDSVRMHDGKLSGVRSYRAYYQFKAKSPTFKKPFTRKQKPYNFTRLFRKYACCPDT